MTNTSRNNLIIAGVGIALLAAAVYTMRPKPAPTPVLSVIVPGTVMHGVQGLAFGPDGMLYGASFFGQSVYKIDPKSGRVEVAVKSPEGEGDDLAFGPAGTPAAGILAWTAADSVHSLTPDGVHHVLVPDAPRANPIAFNKQGRLFFSQSGTPDNELWEIDPLGAKPPRLVAKGQGRLNGFDFGPDGRLYAPLFGTDQIVAIDVETGKYTPIAKGVGSPSAVKVDPQGNLIAVDYKLGDVWQINRATGAVRKIANRPAVIDNLAIGADGTAYLASTADSIVWALNPATGESRALVPGKFNTPLGAAFIMRDGKPTLLVAMPQSFTYLDLASAEPSRPFYGEQRNSSTAVAADDHTIVSITGFGGRLRKIDRASDTLVAENADVKGASGVAIAPNGDIFVTDNAGGRLLKWTDTGMKVVADGFTQPTAVAMESPTSVLIAETGAGQISRVDVNTGQRAVMARGLDRPQGVAKLRDGRIAFAEPGKGVIAAVDSNGRRSELASGLALSTAGLRVPATVPVGLAVGDDGTLYVVCPGDNSLVKIDFVEKS